MRPLSDYSLRPLLPKNWHHKSESMGLIMMFRSYENRTDLFILGLEQCTVVGQKVTGLKVTHFSIFSEILVGQKVTHFKIIKQKYFIKVKQNLEKIHIWNNLSYSLSELQANLSNLSQIFIICSDWLNSGGSMVAKFWNFPWVLELVNSFLQFFCSVRLS